MRSYKGAAYAKTISQRDQQIEKERKKERKRDQIVGETRINPEIKESVTCKFSFSRVMSFFVVFACMRVGLICFFVA